MHHTAHCPNHEGAQLVEEDVHRLSFDGHRLTCGCFLFWDAEDNRPEVLTPEEAEAQDDSTRLILDNLFALMVG